MDEIPELEEILAVIENQFREACKSMSEFLEWRASRKGPPDAESWQRYSVAIEAGKPYALSYQIVASHYKSELPRLAERLIPIQNEYLG